MSRYALVGNPNCGKTSLFNRLTGANARLQTIQGYRRTQVRLYSGLGTPVELIDLPGTYSLATSSLDEQVARDMIRQYPRRASTGFIDRRSRCNQHAARPQPGL